MFILNGFFNLALFWSSFDVNKKEVEDRENKIFYRLNFVRNELFRLISLYFIVLSFFKKRKKGKKSVSKAREKGERERESTFDDLYSIICFNFVDLLVDEDEATFFHSFFRLFGLQIELS